MSGELQLGPIGQIARTVSDVAAAKAWYRDVLGLRHLYTFGELAFFDCGGTRLFLTKPEGPNVATTSSASLLYFRVDDIVAAHEQLLARGVSFVHEPRLIHKHEDGTEEWMAFFNDNEGRLLGIMSQVESSNK